ncbi:fimbria/pilus periplasmic chaperone [Xanthomonas sp. NCPPB 2654]|uniref:fimbrial biogenesis chaperone n=1 Tax=unclassified Xanthomonas TaxID=2643310 RepID=UPI0021E09A7F|nr:MULTISPECIES: fimbria/pilus periplasmic chaperone [unclassified Xanthomonas]MDL5367331.1 fimbria/pilus periplasmic chaperone [Xanthomonas sp. NCPPB 2654]UYC19268.1 fimbria/pilus periplasmic chaperone [Xanthomonas sp. CFBP 8443]
MGRRRRAWIAGLLLALLPSLAAAAGVRISPAIVRVAPGAQTAEIWLNNTQDLPWRAQAQLYRWHQAEGIEQLQPTDDVQLSPHVIDIPAQGRQLLRVVRTGPAATDREIAYRLVLEERAPADTPSGAEPRLLLRYSTPVFLSASGAAPAAALSASLIAGAYGHQLQVRNRGTAHARLSDLSFIGADGSQLTLFQNLAGYVLAGEQKRWPLPAAVGTARGGHFAARLDSDAELRALPAE